MWHVPSFLWVNEISGPDLCALEEGGETGVLFWPTKWVTADGWSHWFDAQRTRMRYGPGYFLTKKKNGDGRR